MLLHLIIKGLTYHLGVNKNYIYQNNTQQGMYSIEPVNPDTKFQVMYVDIDNNSKVIFNGTLSQCLEKMTDSKYNERKGYAS